MEKFNKNDILNNINEKAKNLKSDDYTPLVNEVEYHDHLEIKGFDLDKDGSLYRTLGIEQKTNNANISAVLVEKLKNKLTPKKVVLDEQDTNKLNKLIGDYEKLLWTYNLLSTKNAREALSRHSQAVVDGNVNDTALFFDRLGVNKNATEEEIMEGFMNKLQNIIVEMALFKTNFSTNKNFDKKLTKLSNYLYTHAQAMIVLTDKLTRIQYDSFIGNIDILDALDKVEVKENEEVEVINNDYDYVVENDLDDELDKELDKVVAMEEYDDEELEKQKKKLKLWTVGIAAALIIACVAIYSGCSNKNDKNNTPNKPGIENSTEEEVEETVTEKPEVEEEVEKTPALIGDFTDLNDQEQINKRTDLIMAGLKERNLVFKMYDPTLQQERLITEDDLAIVLKVWNGNSETEDELDSAINVWAQLLMNSYVNQTIPEFEDFFLDGSSNQTEMKTFRKTLTNLYGTLPDNYTELGGTETHSIDTIGYAETFNEIAANRFSQTDSVKPKEISDEASMAIGILASSPLAQPVANVNPKDQYGQPYTKLAENLEEYINSFGQSIVANLEMNELAEDCEEELTNDNNVEKTLSK